MSNLVDQLLRDAVNAPLDREQKSKLLSELMQDAIQESYRVYWGALPTQESALKVTQFIGDYVRVRFPYRFVIEAAFVDDMMSLNARLREE
jgi:hypothetical protein